ncbi:hypothetical protein A3C86_03405 [Candidatus Kaiserbacteria bacterium RIFCSPHIGHO2_02_FULL_49_16]|uniref:Phosphoribosyltransferase domain-containing protein n=1 Tax=Candidatus Kaiserbacteria bacterium RIFCSPHIGHO2_02_FULL_49_16 TaxID=1798490 RepID=A0A1F6DBJ4_9BACT|nr:MAG: hypothetical protein A3C86_03405 [Candidatus Kaiserbacteria bacterium RIFCSPHIGHO2_02_FULL_49_16]
MFKDRSDAGQKLAEKLARYRGSDAVVLSLPRGGVVVGREIARTLGLPLDIIAIRKIGHPFSPEYAIGAVDDKKAVLLNDSETESVNQAWLADEIEREIQEAKRRVKAYRGPRKPVSIPGKVALIVDDGIATGLTMRLAVRSVRAQSPERIVVAVPIAPVETINNLRKEADEVVILEPPEEFLGVVGAHYIEFKQVEDAEVIRLLSEDQQEKPSID